MTWWQGTTTPVLCLLRSQGDGAWTALKHTAFSSAINYYKITICDIWKGGLQILTQHRTLFQIHQWDATLCRPASSAVIYRQRSEARDVKGITRLWRQDDKVTSANLTRNLRPQLPTAPHSSTNSEFQSGTFGTAEPIRRSAPKGVLRVTEKLGVCGHPHSSSKYQSTLTIISIGLISPVGLGLVVYNTAPTADVSEDFWKILEDDTLCPVEEWQVSRGLKLR
jgi:hypothetical protein